MVGLGPATLARRGVTMDIEQLLGDAEASGDPTRRLIVRFLRERLTAPAAGAEVVSDAEPRLRAALRSARRRNARLAAACGACPCWGERPACPRCAGQGLPGALAPDPQAFLEYIAPVLRAIGLIQATKEGNHDDPK